MKRLLTGLLLTLVLCSGCATVRSFIDQYKPGVLLDVVTNVVTDTSTTTNAVVETNVVAEAGTDLNPVLTDAEIATGQNQQAKWKADNDGKGGNGAPARTVVRWPSYLTARFDIDKDNSYTTINGERVPFQKIDGDDKNARASYEIIKRADTFPAESQVYLVVDGNIVAGFKKRDTGLYVDFPLPKRMKDVVK